MQPESRLDELLSQYERLQDEGQTPTAEEMCRDCPELKGMFLQRLNQLRHFQRVLDDQAGFSAETAAVEEELIATRSTYRVQEMHARGGLGEVLRARDENLGREVALKRIQRPLDRSSERRSRFLREAEITGRLEHPGVVPVYGMGEDAAGRPYYVMRLIQGETLASAIERFHRQPGNRSLAFRQLLSRYVAVCNAVAYAHGRQVVHRDLKPSNVMLGDYGETLVVDWGLARRQDAVDDAAPLTPGVGAQTEENATKSGAILGTPAYMSPEQAAGRLTDIGPASDVYSLGATLYSILTGQAPFRAEAGGPILERVQRGDLPPPRVLRPETPLPLQAICLKAMARRPEDRYATALELAADIEHWLADEPVRAYPEPWTARLRRWIGRHRTLVASTAAASGAALSVLTVATVLLLDANRRERRASDAAAAGYQRARQAVDEYFVQVSQGKLKSLPGAQPVRRELLQAALRYYQGFVELRENDGASRADFAVACRNMGQIIEDIGKIEDALTWYERAVAAFRQIREESPNQPEYQKQLARVLYLYGHALRRAGKLAEDIRAGAEAIALAAEMNRIDPTDDEVEETLLRAVIGMAVTQGSMGRYEEAVLSGMQGLKVAERRLNRLPNDRVTRVLRGNLAMNLGTDQLDLSRFSEAIDSLQLARGIFEELVREEDADPSLALYTTASAGPRHFLPITLNNLGNIHFTQGHYAEAADFFQRAISAFQRLGEAEPTVFQHRIYRLTAAVNLARTRLLQGQFSAALGEAQHARELGEQLLHQDPKRVTTGSLLGTAWSISGAALAQAGQRQPATAALEKALQFHQKAQTQAPDDQPNRLRFGAHYLDVADVHILWREPLEAVAAARLARQTASKDPALQYEAARRLAQCVSLTESEKDKESLATEAVATLGQAAKHGFKDWERMKREGDFAILLGRTDAQELLRGSPRKQ